MTAEFFVPAWLKARPVLYLVSHLVIMAFIDFYVTAAEWLPHVPLPPPGIWVFVLLSCVNGCVLEFGRKTWAPENERDGVETWSALYGPVRAAAVWAGSCVLSCLLLGVIGTLAGAGWQVWLLGAVALAPVLLLALRFMQHPDAAGQRRIELAAALWVFACYVLAGIAGML
jgi:4-hydroxybenzoate polyprenyltransferase